MRRWNLMLKCCGWPWSAATAVYPVAEGRESRTQGPQMPAVGQTDGGRAGVSLPSAAFKKPKQGAKQLLTIAGT